MSSNDFNVNHLHVSGNMVLKGVAIVSPKPGNKIRIGTVAPGVIIAPSGPLSEVTLLFPKNVADGQVMYLSFTQDVGNLIYSGANFANGSQLGPKVKAGDSITLLYDKKTDKWYKLAGGSAPVSA